MAEYYPGPTPTGDLEQTQRWLRDETEQIHSSTEDIYTLADIVKQLYQIAGYGQIGLDVVTPLADIGVAWQQLPFDVELLTGPRAVTYNLAGDGMALNEPGVWSFFAKVALEFTETQAGRRIQLTLWRTDTNTPIGPLFNFSIGRNTDGVNLSFQIMFDVSLTVGIPLGLAVSSSTDTYTGVTAIGSIFGVNYQSEYKGDLFDEARELLGA